MGITFQHQREMPSSTVISILESSDWSNKSGLDRSNGGDTSPDAQDLFTTIYSTIDTYAYGAKVHDIFTHEANSSNVSHIVALTTGRHFVLTGFDTAFYITPAQISELYTNHQTIFKATYAALRTLIPPHIGTVCMPVIAHNPDSGYWSILITRKLVAEDGYDGTSPNDNRYYDLVPLSYIYNSPMICSDVPAAYNIIKILSPKDAQNSVWRSKYMGRNDGHEVVRHIGEYDMDFELSPTHLNAVLTLMQTGAWPELIDEVTANIDAAAANHPTI